MANSEGSATDTTKPADPGAEMRNLSPAERLEEEIKKRQENGESALHQGEVFEGLVNQLLKLVAPVAPDGTEQPALGKFQPSDQELEQRRNVEDLKKDARDGDEEAQRVLHNAEFWLRKIAEGDFENVRIFIKNNLKLGRAPTEEDIDQYSGRFLNKQTELRGLIKGQDQRDVSATQDLERDSDYQYAKWLAKAQNNAMRDKAEKDLIERQGKGEDVTEEWRQFRKDLEDAAIENMLDKIGLNLPLQGSTKARLYIDKLAQFAVSKQLDPLDKSLAENAPPWVRQAQLLLSKALEKKTRTQERGAPDKQQPSEDEVFQNQRRFVEQQQGNPYSRLDINGILEELRKQGQGEYAAQLEASYRLARDPEARHTLTEDMIRIDGEAILLRGDMNRRDAKFLGELGQSAEAALKRGPRSSNQIDLYDLQGQLIEERDQALRAYVESRVGSENAESYYSVYSAIAKMTLQDIRAEYVNKIMFQFVEEPNADWDDLKFGQIREILHALQTVKTQDERDAGRSSYSIEEKRGLGSQRVTVSMAEIERDINEATLLYRQGDPSMPFDKFQTEIERFRARQQALESVRNKELERIQAEKNDLFIEVMGRINLQNILRTCFSGSPEQIAQTVKAMGGEERQVTLITKKMGGVSQALNILEEDDGAYWRSQEASSMSFRAESVPAEVRAQEVDKYENPLKLDKDLWAIRKKIQIIKDKERTDYVTRPTLAAGSAKDSEMADRTCIIDARTSEGQKRDQLARAMGLDLDVFLTALYVKDAELRKPGSATQRELTTRQIAHDLLMKKFMVENGDGTLTPKIKGVTVGNAKEIAYRLADMAQEASLAMNLAHKMAVMEGRGPQFESHQWQTKDYLEELTKFNEERKRHGLDEVDNLPNHAEPTRITLEVRWKDDKITKDLEEVREINVYALEKAAQYVLRKREYLAKFKAYYGYDLSLDPEANQPVALRADNLEQQRTALYTSEYRADQDRQAKDRSEYLSTRQNLSELEAKRPDRLTDLEKNQIQQAKKLLHNYPDEQSYMQHAQQRYVREALNYKFYEVPHKESYQRDDDEGEQLRKRFLSEEAYLKHAKDHEYLGLKDFFTAYGTLNDYVKGYEVFDYNKYAKESHQEELVDGRKMSTTRMQRKNEMLVLERNADNRSVWEFDEQRFIRDKKAYEYHKKNHSGRDLPYATDLAVLKFQDENFERFNVNDELKRPDYVELATYEAKRQLNSRRGLDLSLSPKTKITEQQFRQHQEDFLASITNGGARTNERDLMATEDMEAWLYRWGKKLAAEKYPIGQSFKGKNETMIRRLYHFAGYSIKESTHANNSKDQRWLSRTADLLVRFMGRCTATLSIQEMAENWDADKNVRAGAWDERYIGGDKLRKVLLDTEDQILHASNGMRFRTAELYEAYLKALGWLTGGAEQLIGKHMMNRWLTYAMNMLPKDTPRHTYMSLFEADSQIRQALSNGRLGFGHFHQLRSELMGWLSFGGNVAVGDFMFGLSVFKSKASFVGGIVGFIMDLIKGGAQGILVGR